MSLYSINNPVELEKQADVTNLALWAGMLPQKGTTSRGVDYIHFSNGKNNVFVTTRGMSKEELVSNLSNVCRSAHLDPRAYVLPLVEEKTDAHRACEAIYNKISRSHRMTSQEELSALMNVVSKNATDYDKIAYELGVDVGVRQDVRTQMENSLQSVSRVQADKKMRAMLEDDGMESSGEPTPEK